jgi:metal-responsive CopG/Arc/MetJ family transcriptional regulator
MVARMARRQVLVQLDDTQIAELDQLVAGGQDSRSGLIRRAVDLYLSAVEEGLADVRYAEAYRQIPEDLEEHAALRAHALAAWPEG